MRIVLTKDEICRLIPHRDPFLWIDEVVAESENRLVARKFVSPELDVFRGHYPGQPVLPGVLLCEAAMQAGAGVVDPPGLPEARDPPAAATRGTPVKYPSIVGARGPLGIRRVFQ